MAPSVSSSSYSTLPRRSTPQSVSPRTSPESQEPEESATAAKQTNDKRRSRSGTIAVGVRASPSDFYETSGARNGMTTLELARHASQATMWYTTVPQSIQPQHLGSRHTPSRRSLRHSRMVGLSKQGKIQVLYPGNAANVLNFQFWFSLTWILNWMGDQSVTRFL